MVWASVRVLGAGRVEQRSNGGCWGTGCLQTKGKQRAQAKKEKKPVDAILKKAKEIPLKVAELEKRETELENEIKHNYIKLITYLTYI
jgi:hypothetical protein